MAYLKCGDDLHSRLKVFAAERDTTMQSLVEAWVTQGMGGDADATPRLLQGISKQYREAIETLATLARENKVPDMLDVIRRAINAAEKMAKRED
jgi:hypothetical protein